MLLLPIIVPSVQRSACNSIRAQSATLQPFHLAFPVRDVSEAKDFYGAKLGLQEGRSAKSWVDYSLFGHQIVCHHIQGYNATNTANAGIYGHILQQCLNFYSWKQHWSMLMITYKGHQQHQLAKMGTVAKLCFALIHGYFCSHEHCLLLSYMAYSALCSLSSQGLS